MEREGVAEAFEEIASLLLISGENPHRARAYEKAARELGRLRGTLRELVEGERLGQVRGLGEALREKVAECHRTGRLEYLERLRSSVPPGLREMLELPGLGPSKIRAIHGSLGIESIGDLQRACQEGRVASLPRFGTRMQERILEGIRFRQENAGLHLHAEALEQILPMLDWLSGQPGVLRCSLAGSLRRGSELAESADLLASASRAGAVLEGFASQDGIAAAPGEAPGRSSFATREGLRVDLRVVGDEEYPFALARLTGSREHNAAMERRARKLGLRLDERGLFPEGSDRSLACRTEEELFARLDLEWIEPELREDRGEIEAAEAGALPRLVEWTDLKGSLHNHSDWSDGEQSLEEIAAMARKLGCQYWAVTDHSRASFQANGLGPERLLRQLEAVGEVNARLEGRGDPFRLLTGTEVDILADGRLDFEDGLLERLDVVVASLHQPSLSDSARNTGRLIRAARNPHVRMLGHLSGRLLLRRRPYPVDQKAVIDACAETGTWIELNASPWRCDLDWRLWPYARERGVRCAINCDAHCEEHARYLRSGAVIARKGWLEPEDVANALPLEQLRRELSAKRP